MTMAASTAPSAPAGAGRCPRRFTEAQLEIAKRTDLPDLLTALGYHVQQVGSYHTTKEMDSLRIRDRRVWFRYSEQVGGDAIAFLQHFQNKSFVDAVEFLLAYHGRARDSPREPPPSAAKKEKPPFVLPPQNPDHRRVFAYLRKRGVAPQVIRGFIAAGLLYEDAQYHNCVFVGRNQSGQPVFANRRGTFDQGGSSFKGDVPGGDKDVAFRLPGDVEKDGVFVFEAPIDLMSFCTLHRDVTANAVALCGLYEGGLDTYLRENPHIRYIFLCLDADEHGREAAERLREKYARQGRTVSYKPPPRGKDWNEYLQRRQKCRDRGR